MVVGGVCVYVCVCGVGCGCLFVGGGVSSKEQGARWKRRGGFNDL